MSSFVCVTCAFEYASTNTTVLESVLESARSVLSSKGYLILMQDPNTSSEHSLFIPVLVSPVVLISAQVQTARYFKPPTSVHRVLLLSLASRIHNPMVLCTLALSI